MTLVKVDAGKVTDIVSGIIERVWPNKSAEEKAALDRELEIAKGQMAVNAVEAANPNMFIAGWRPFIGWVCGSGLVWQFIGVPICSMIGFQPPPVDTGTLTTLLIAMLGLGGMRTAEKMTGTEGKR